MLLNSSANSCGKSEPEKVQQKSPSLYRLLYPQTNYYVGDEQEGRRDPNRANPITCARELFCDAETPPEPPHKDRWHGASLRRGSIPSITTLSRYYCHARSSPVPPPKKTKKPLPPGGGGGGRWLLNIRDHQARRQTHREASLLCTCRRRRRRGTFL